MLTELVGNLHHLRVGLVGEAALLVAQRPQWRQRHGAGEVDQCLHERLRALALNDHHPESRTKALESHLMVVGGDGLAPGVVGDDAEGRAVGTYAHYPWVALVEMRATVDAVGRSVDIPQAHGASVAAQWSGHLARAIEIDLARDGDGGHALAIAHGELRPDFPLCRQRIDGLRLMLEDGRRLVLRGIVVWRIEHRHLIIGDKGSLRHCHDGKGEAAYQHDDSSGHTNLLIT